ncbi:MAG: hypothetical protein IPN08_10410 [Bacteroidales bacterium]|nr:hypothetical protein [Bacteroidales bacterium]
MRINFPTLIRIFYAASLLLVSPLFHNAKAQNFAPDTLMNTATVSVSDSLATLMYMLDEQRAANSRLAEENAVLQNKLELFVRETEAMKSRQASLIQYNDSLNNRLTETGKQLELKNSLLESQVQLQKEKELLFAEKEQLYREAISSSIIDKVKLEGQIATKDSRLDGKEREISLLQQSIGEKNRDLGSRNAEIMKIVSEKSKAEQRIDSLRTSLTTTEKNLLMAGEQLKYTDQKLKDCENRYSSLTNKKKKTKVVQGFAIKNYRTPDFALAPKDAANPSVYVISNKNSSNMEFDFVTGASIMLKDLTKPGGALTYDVGFFLGFGGNNLFKNFYLGPNFKLFDVLHVNLGANVAEYEVLKDGFHVGDVLQPGISIPTTREWRINGYIGFTFDLELITMIGKR